MVKRDECLAYEHRGWRFEWYVNDEGNSPGAKYYQEELDEDDKDELTALFEFLAECNGSETRATSCLHSSQSHIGSWRSS